MIIIMEGKIMASDKKNKDVKDNTAWIKVLFTIILIFWIGIFAGNLAANYFIKSKHFAGNSNSDDLLQIKKDIEKNENPNLSSVKTFFPTPRVTNEEKPEKTKTPEPAVSGNNVLSKNQNVIDTEKEIPTPTPEPAVSEKPGNNINETNTVKIQYGAFSSKENAEKLQIELRNNAIASQIIEINKDGQIIYKLLSVSSVDKEKAQKEIQDIKTKLNIDPIVIK
jgi:cell division protein FtsN